MLEESAPPHGLQDFVDCGGQPPASTHARSPRSGPLTAVPRIPTFHLTMSPSAPKLRALYRSFLRELPPRPILKKRSPVHERLREHFHHETSQLASAAGVAQAEQYLAYMRAQRTYVTLLERYNPGMGMDEAERVRLSARRIGVELPTEYKKE